MQKSRIKVNNWLISPEPELPPASENYLLIDQQKRKGKNKLLPNIKKANVATNDTDNEANKSYFKKDPWVGDEESRPNKKYDSNLPVVNHKAIYELLNKLTNRKPVQINADTDLFADIQENNHIFKTSRQKVVPRRSNDNHSNKKILKPIENQDSEKINRKKSMNQVCLFLLLLVSIKYRFAWLL